MLIMLSNFPHGPRCTPTPAQICCETGSPAPRRAIRTSRGSCAPTTGARSATAQLRDAHRAASPRCCAARGLGRNDRVALLANNSIEHLVCYFGVMAYGATICTVHVEMNRNQLDNIFARLKPKLVLYQDGLRARRSARARCRRRGCGSAAGTRPPPTRSSARSRAARRRDARHGRRAGRRCGDPVHLRHQRQAEGRGAELPRAPLQHRSDRRRLRHHGRRPALRFPLVQLGLGAAPRRAGAGQPRRHAGDGAEILRQPLLPACARASRHRRRRQPDHDQHPAQRRAGARTATTCRRCASSPRARRRSRSRNGGGSRSASAFRSRRATARARPAGSRRSPARARRLGTVGRPFAYHDLAIVDGDGGGCRRARSARSRSAASPITTTAISPRTAA